MQENLTIERLRNWRSAVLKPEQYAALLNRIETHTGADVLAAPRLSPVDSGRQAHFADQDLQTIVTGVQTSDASPTNQASINYHTSDVACGFSVDVLPTVEQNGKWHLRVEGNFLRFLGYDKPTNDIVKAATSGKPVKGVLPLPHFRILEGDAEDSLPLGQTMAVRCGELTETTTTKAHFLVRAKTTTVRERLYVFVTPTLPPSPGTK